MEGRRGVVFANDLIKCLSLMTMDANINHFILTSTINYIQQRLSIDILYGTHITIRLYIQKKMMLELAMKL